MFKVMAKKTITFFAIKYPLPKHAGSPIIRFYFGLAGFSPPTPYKTRILVRTSHFCPSNTMGFRTYKIFSKIDISKRSPFLKLCLIFIFIVPKYSEKLVISFTNLQRILSKYVLFYVYFYKKSLDI